MEGIPPPQVLWSNFKREINAWQGALEHKESYMRHFLSQTKTSVRRESYDMSKLIHLLDAVLEKASALSAP
jgi:hypothetical protein